VTDYTITYYSDAVGGGILALPGTLATRYVVPRRRIVALGPDLGEPHTRVFGGGLIELRSKMAAHDRVVKKRRRRPGVRAEVKRIEREESVLLDALLKARHAAGLTQAQVAERMGTQAPAVARLERSLATGKHSPSIATVRNYVGACGKRLVLRVA
jgi:DNA-binding XRE family transcriptional regulator